MADTDLVACLYPFEDNWNHAKEVIEKLNESRCVPGRLSLPEVQYGRHDREPTEEPGNSEASPLDYLPRIELRFSHGPRTSNGFVFGWDENSDIVLPWARGISFHHFAVTFDGRNYPVVKDLGSFSGIEVTYDRKGQGKRRDFVWIVGGYPIPEQTSIIINVNEQLKFQIVVPYHDISSQLYVDNVNKFRQGTTGVDNLVGQLDLRSRPPTERTSGTHTPGTGPIVLKKALGEGGFGVVSYMWDVSTGAEHALKEPSSKAIRANIVDIDAWMKEARIMGQISHENIVAFYGSTFTPWPQLCFEYMPGGALEYYTNTSAAEGVQILCQCLSTLAYLHGLEPPVIHRDIKPENILVQYRNAGYISVKFGDFGLSRDVRDPTTLCGSLLYLAPEIYTEMDRRHGRNPKRSYTAAVDVWSLGVAVLECVYALPSSKATGVDWCQAIVNKLEADIVRGPDGLQQLLYDGMVKMNPELRGSAEACYHRVLLLSDAGEDLCRTPTAAPGKHLGSIQSFQSFKALEEYGENHQAVLLQDAQTAAQWPDDLQEEDPIDSAAIWRYQRSYAPPPTSQMSGDADASRATNYDSWVTWAGGQTPVPEGKENLHGSQGLGPAAQAPQEQPGWTAVPPDLYDPEALQVLVSNSHVSLKQRRKRSSKSSSGRKDRKRQTDQESSNHVLPDVPEWDTPWQEPVQLNMPASPIEDYRGQGFEAEAEDRPAVGHTAWEDEQNEETELFDSEVRIAAALLITIRNDT